MDIRQAISEVEAIVINPTTRISQNAPIVVDLMKEIFNTGCTEYNTVSDQFTALSRLTADNEFVVICDNDIVRLEIDKLDLTSDNPIPDSNGV